MNINEMHQILIKDWDKVDILLYYNNNGYFEVSLIKIVSYCKDDSTFSYYYRDPNNIVSRLNTLFKRESTDFVHHLHNNKNVTVKMKYNIKSKINLL